MIGKKGDQLLILNEDNTCDLVPVEASQAELNTGQEVYPRDQAACFVQRDGGQLYVMSVDLVTRAEAAKVSGLATSAHQALSDLFNDDRQNSGGVPLPFWILVFALLLAVILK